VYSVGLGDVTIKPGDRIIPVGNLYRSTRYGTPTTTLILRQCDPNGDLNGENPVYRLVGRGYTYDPTSVLLRDEFKRYYHSIQDKKINPHGFKRRWRKLSHPEKEAQKFSCVLDLA